MVASDLLCDPRARLANSARSWGERACSTDLLQNSLPSEEQASQACFIFGCGEPCEGTSMRVFLAGLLALALVPAASAQTILKREPHFLAPGAVVYVDA